MTCLDISAIAKLSESLSSFSRVKLINQPTDLARMSVLEQKWKRNFLGQNIYVKREDQTDGLYGGNKVRNLEFILGDARKKGINALHTVAPMGSNFAAAMVAQASKTDFKSHVLQFEIAQSDQIKMHADFYKNLGARVDERYGAKGAVISTMKSLQMQATNRHVYHVTAGGSSVLGALGHVSAFVEMVQQFRAGKMKLPEYLVVGAGTCGTISGMVAANDILQTGIKIVGIRCADPIVCNPIRINFLVRGIKNILRESQSGSNAYTLVDAHNAPRYGKTLANFYDIYSELWNAEAIHLDKTYTGKIFSTFKKLVLENYFGDSSVLYWHTYSPAVYRACDHSQSIAIEARAKPQTLAPAWGF